MSQFKRNVGNFAQEVGDFVDSQALVNKSTAQSVMSMACTIDVITGYLRAILPEEERERFDERVNLALQEGQLINWEETEGDG